VGKRENPQQITGAHQIRSRLTCSSPQTGPHPLIGLLDEQRKPAAHFRLVEEKLTAEGVVKEAKPYKATEPNIELPVQIAPKGSQTSDDLVQKFVVHKIYQVIHLDSLSFDFLFKLCQEIQPLDFVRVNGGIKGNEPLILRREGLPAFAYLRGRVEGDKYCCTLHLTHTELKLLQNKYSQDARRIQEPIPSGCFKDCAKQRQASDAPPETYTEGNESRHADR
jgi:hypothetical protein